MARGRSGVAKDKDKDKDREPDPKYVFSLFNKNGRSIEQLILWAQIWITFPLINVVTFSWQEQN